MQLFPKSESLFIRGEEDWNQRFVIGILFAEDRGGDFEVDAAEDGFAAADPTFDNGGWLAGEIGVAGEDSALGEITVEGAPSIIVRVEDAVLRY